MSNKNPYEIRLDLLYLAQRILTEQNMNKRIQIENDWNMQCEAVRDKGGQYPKFPEVPQYGVEEVVSMADTLNSFVSKNG